MLQIYIAVAVIVIAVLLVLLLVKQYRRVGPNEALIVSGGKKTKVYPGGGSFVMPFIEDSDVLPLEVFSLDIHIDEALTSQGVMIQAEGVGQVKIDNTESAILTAAEQFTGKGKEGIVDAATVILEGYMRSELGSRTVEEIYKNRDDFSNGVRVNAQRDFQNLGLTVVSFTLKGITDNQGYLEALGKPKIAKVKHDAEVQQAEMDKDAKIKAALAREEGEIVRFESEAKIAEAGKEFELKRAAHQVDINSQKAKADFSYDLERYRLSQDLKRQEGKVKLVEKELGIELEEKEIERREKELEASIVKPAAARKAQAIAEAEAEQFRIASEAKAKSEAARLEGEADVEVLRGKALAEAEAMLKKAESWSKYNEAAVYQLFIEMLPELARAVAEPLSNVDRIVMIDGDGGKSGPARLTRNVAELMSQVPEIIESMSGYDVAKLLNGLTGLNKADSEAGPCTGDVSGGAADDSGSRDSKKD